MVMGMPFGRVLVAAVGVGVLAVGGYHVYKGVSEKFLEDLRTTGGGTSGRVDDVARHRDQVGLLGTPTDLAPLAEELVEQHLADVGVGQVCPLDLVPLLQHLEQRGLQQVLRR